MMNAVLDTHGFGGFLTLNLFLSCQQWRKTSYVDENDNSLLDGQIYEHLSHPCFPQELSYS